MPRGFSLLEVLLALVILGSSVAIISELIRQGTHSSRMARHLTRAEILCESVLAEVVAGSLPAEPAAMAPIPDETDAEGNPMFSYNVDVEPLDVEGLIAVHVTVVGSLPNDPAPVEFSLTRWMVDPQYVFPDPPQALSSSSSSTPDSGTTQESNSQQNSTNNQSSSTPSPQGNQQSAPNRQGQGNGRR
jgi:prepilin-type N-terminal cleavage/methylation domain-containing protein